MIRAQIVGATGYGGLGITEALLRHPQIEIVGLLAKTDVGKPISDFFPHLRGFCDRLVEDATPERIGADCDVVVFATPDGVGMQYATQVLDRGARLVDYSGDYRFESADRYAEYARRHPAVGGKPHQTPALLGQNVYGIPELFRDRIKDARVVGNPGCFAIAMILSLAPAVKAGIVDPRSLIVDGKTGISGAGKKPTPSFHFPAADGSVTPYRVAKHQHAIETEMALKDVGGEAIGLTFVPHLVPITRGIEVTAYATLRREVTPEAVHSIYREFYAGEPFVRVLPPGVVPGLKTVIGSNLLDISHAVDRDNGRLVVMGAIDNLVKGQAGNALQNINVMFGFPETTGLERIPLYP